MPENLLTVGKEQTRLTKLTEAAIANKEKLKHTAQKAKEIKKKKGVPVVVCESNEK